jgi:SAM-dependent methyltransferase
MNRIHRWLCRSAAWRAALRRKILPWVLDGVSLGDDLLEVGPGPGLTTDSLRMRAARVTAVEIDRRLAAALARRLGRSNVAVVRGDGACLPFADGAFSSAVSMTMLHHVPTADEQDRLMREVHRVLAPGGWFVGTDSTTSLLFRLLHAGDTMTLVDPNGLEARLRAAGFGDVRVDLGRGRFRFRSRKAAAV